MDSGECIRHRLSKRQNTDLLVCRLQMKLRHDAQPRRLQDNMVPAAICLLKLTKVKMAAAASDCQVINDAAVDLLLL